MSRTLSVATIKACEHDVNVSVYAQMDGRSQVVLEEGGNDIKLEAHETKALIGVLKAALRIAADMDREEA